MKYDLEQLKESVKNNKSIAGVLKQFGLYPTGANYTQLNRLIKTNSINIDHFLGQAHFRGQKIGTTHHNSYTKTPIGELLVEEKQCQTSKLRKRLVKEGIFENKCYKCNIKDWLNEPLVVQLHHINGINDDNRLENLILLCPNCHSQTDTFSGKNRKKITEKKCKGCEKEIPYNRKWCEECFDKQQYVRINKKIPTCMNCNTPVSKENSRCKSCAGKLRTPTKIQWPTNEELENLVWKQSTESLGKQLGVSGKAIENRCKRFGIDKPPRGYWAKQQAGSNT